MPLTFRPTYGSAHGPLGFPLTDKQAFALEAILKALPKDSAYAYRKSIIERGLTELLPGERADVSWISTEDPDRMGDVVLARGMNDAQFRLNPIVTLNHCYTAPPVGRSLWRKVVRDGEQRGVKAKTLYPSRPADWSGDWPADVAFALVQAELLRGKSIGFLPTKVHVPDEKEIQQHGWSKVGLVIDEWILLEYACVFLPAQQNAVVEQVARSLPSIPADIQDALGIDLKSLSLDSPPSTQNSALSHSALKPIPFTTLATIESALSRRFDSFDPARLASDRVQDHLDRARGRV
jgi:hypothetical protein